LEPPFKFAGDTILVPNGGSAVIAIVLKELNLLIATKEFQVGYLEVKQPLIFANTRHNIKHEFVEACSASLGNGISSCGAAVVRRMIGNTLGLYELIALESSEEGVKCAGTDLLPRANHLIDNMHNEIPVVGRIHKPTKNYEFIIHI
jgi:hypothetical protein